MGIYHERQELLRCGVHALNNLLQTRAFDAQQLDGACMTLAAMSSPGSSSLRARLWNPHRSALGLGNYDVNALLLVLQERGHEVRWVDKRQRITSESIDFDVIEGVLCNVVTFGGLFSRIGLEQRHWFAIKKIDGLCFNLDSKLAEPAPFAGDDECRTFLQELLDTGECELLVVTMADKGSEDQVSSS